MCNVSVILPVLNAGAHLARAIHSIQKQSYEDWELIIVDDNSTDRSQAVANEFARADTRIKPTTHPQSGIAHALNHGISLSQGSYIARMDADDVSHPDRLEKQVSYLDQHPDIGLVATQVNFLGDREAQQGYAAYVDWTNQLLDWEDIRGNRFVESPFAHPSVMFRKSAINSDAGPYRDGDFPEDYELWLRWMENGIQMAKLDLPLLDWYDPPNRLSRTDPRYSPDAFYAIKSYYLARWLKKQKHNERPLWIWGAGRITRKRAQLLQQEGIPFAGYLDIDPRKAGTTLKGVPVLLPEQLDLSQNPFVISYVGSRGAREKIRNFLLRSGLVEELDFILAA